MLNKTIFGLLSLARNKYSLDIVNNICDIDNYNKIIPNIYLGNIKGANDINFLQNNNIEAIVNCTIDEQFNEYFNDKLKYRLSINDSKEGDNIIIFKKNIFDVIDFIENAIEQNKNVYIHCYWGLMRSATVVCAYLIKTYNLPINNAIEIIKEQRPSALVSYYNFNEVLKYVENESNNNKN